jgi:hypothetical protein
MSILQTDQIAILGWGSLLWEPNTLFQEQIGDWAADGPVLPIEFSRISVTRNGALTLVTDPDNGVPVRTLYTISKRESPEDAVCDLRSRESTILRHIGLVDFDKEIYRGHWTSILDKIILWAEKKQIRAVVWTDLPSNFTEKTNKIFNTENAIVYLKNLSTEGKKSAIRYIRNAPNCVVTPLRTILSQHGG